MYYLSLGKVWEIQDAALKMSAKQDDRGGRTTPSTRPPCRPPSPFLSKRTFFLGWQYIWQKPSEAGTWYCFSIPPSFYAFLIFKAIIGLRNKILSNQILFSNLMLWLPSGRKSWWGPCWLSLGVGGVLFE